MSNKNNKLYFKQITIALNNGQDNEALEILKQSDQFLSICSIKKILYFCCQNELKIDASKTLSFLLYESQHHKTLISLVDLNSIFIDACKNGLVEIVKILLKDNRVDPSDQNNKALESACFNGHINIVKLLLKIDNIRSSKDLNHVMKVAHINKHVDVRNYIYNLLTAS